MKVERLSGLYDSECDAAVGLEDVGNSPVSSWHRMPVPQPSYRQAVTMPADRPDCAYANKRVKCKCYLCSHHVRSSINNVFFAQCGEVTVCVRKRNLNFCLWRPGLHLFEKFNPSKHGQK
jgi:hypothetical protein